MSRLFYHVMQDSLGNLLLDVSGTMRIAGTGTLATIYGDEALTVILPNPMTNHSSFGSFKCFLGVGDYDFYMAKVGYTFETLTGVQGYGSMAQQEANAVAITGGAVTGLSGLGVIGQSIQQGAVRIGSDVAPGFTLDVTGGAQITGQSIIQNALRVGSAVLPGFTLDVTGGAQITGQSIIQNALRVGSAVLPGFPLDVTGAANISGQAVIQQALRVGSTVLPGFTLDVTGGANISGQSMIHNALRVGSNVLPGVTLDVTGTAQISTAMRVGSAVPPESTLDVTGTANISGQAMIQNALRVGSDVPPGFPLDVTGTANINGQAMIQNALRVGSAIAPGFTLDVTGGAQISGQSIIQNALRVGSNVLPGFTLDVTGGVQVSGQSILQGAVRVGSDVAPGVPLDVTGGAQITGPSMIHHSLRIGSAVLPTCPLDVTGTAQISGALVVTETAQAANASITGVIVPNFTSGSGTVTAFSGQVVGGANRYNVYMDGTAANYMRGALGVGAQAVSGTTLTVSFDKSIAHGLLIQQNVNDAGTGRPVLFHNVAGTEIGSITSTGTNVAYNTASDARLKTDVDDMTGELALIRALRPVRFKWRADDSPGVGFLASEVQQVLPDAHVITGTPDATHDDGTIKPQMIDYSKLVPFLVGACKTLAAQNEALQARLALLEDAVGV